MIVKVENGCFSYDSEEHAVFEGIEMQIDAGEVLCILGPNGVGKTSLLKCLSGLFRLTDGRVLCKGRDLRQMKRSEIAGIIAHVPQVHHPVFAFTVFEAVLMGRTPYLGMFSYPDAQDEQVAQSALATLGISHLAQKPYTEISGGERQLVLFARVIAQQPELIVLDEPTSHLDYGNQLKILSLIRQLSQQGTAVIMTSHNPDHAFMVADTVGIMFDGTIEGFDRPRKIITEEALRRIYGVRVRLHHDKMAGPICIPELPAD